MALEISGKLVKILNPQTGTGRNGNWQKQEFVIETPDQYPKKVCITAWGDKMDDLSKHSIGDQLKVSVNIESREYNDKWYTDVRAWRIETEGSGSATQQQPRRQPDANDNFGFEPYTPGTP